ncbi:MAG TPA: 3'-5' exonuclease [Gaiellaceae bacterium]|nr:3'-5' exonuclease [Gaiellaceae bacterium]
MQFLIADTFTDSLTRLTAEEQKAVKTTAFDLQTNPAHPSLQFHRLDRAKDRNFWSVRAGRDIRLIVHKSEATLALCYADHHDKAYAWAERRKLTTHPTTGAAQLVEIRETVQEIVVPVYVQAEAPAIVQRPLFADFGDDELLRYGVPVDWLDDVRAADDQQLLALAEHLPGEAAEALLERATGGTPQLLGALQVLDLPADAGPAYADPFEHPDAQRRFRVVENVEELERALEHPWDRWIVFLHPAQRNVVERDYGGPARVSGSAGTGKTIVALHRAVFLARANPEARILLTTYTDTLASALRSRLMLLIQNEPRIAERIDVQSISGVGQRLYQAHAGEPRIATREDIEGFIRVASEAVDPHKFQLHFLVTEWEQVVDSWQLRTWDDYRDVRRLGRKTGLPEQQRAILWSIFERVEKRLAEEDMLTEFGMFTRLSDLLMQRGGRPYDHIVVDEAQDMGVAHLRFFATLAEDRRNALFFAGDLGQRIFQQPFSWRALGVDIRGRSRNLHVNYRTSHQIRQNADRLLDPEQTDADGNIESRAGTVSVFNGVPPTIRVFDDEEAEVKAVATWMRDLVDDGLAPEELSIFVRSEAELERARRAVEAAGLTAAVLDEKVRTTRGTVSVSTMDLAKGLEFRAVVVMGCDDEVIPSQARIEAIADNADLEDVYTTERHLLYVACTRARDHLWISGVEPASEFLDDLTSK